jgi:glutamate/tyrosine decarboxylase-like PLP-dependent enzyme
VLFLKGNAVSFETDSLVLLAESLKLLDEGFSELPNFSPEIDTARIRDVLNEVAVKMRDNYPYFSPLYAGQMLKPPHPIARLAYCLSIYINPNNHALDGGRASSAMEKEAVAEIAKMFGWESHLGHLCGGGTMANLEALWVSGKLHPGKKVVASEQAHYTHRRISEVLKIPYASIPVDARARMSLDFLEKALRNGDVGTVVVTLGTTGTGSVDPLSSILELRNRYQFRIHADCAYGGYYCLADGLSAEVEASLSGLRDVDSIVVDPHKHGLQPYGCGCVLFRDPSVGSFYRHDSPYTYFSSNDLHLGEISLECSRPGASATALWATQKLLPMVKGGQFADGLSKCRKAALTLYGLIKRDDRFFTLFPPDLDIVIWAKKASRLSEITSLSKSSFFDAARENLHLALIQLPAELVGPHWKDVSLDQTTVTCLRSCLMKPEHLEWINEIWSILDRIS